MSNPPPKFPSRPAPAPAAAAAAPEPKPAGKVKFDHRGNAIYEWSISTGEFGRDSSTARLRKLDNPSLSLAEDAPAPLAGARPNPMGIIKGYNPYDSGRLGGKEIPKKTDLQKLSEWLTLRKQAAANKHNDK